MSAFDGIKVGDRVRVVYEFTVTDLPEELFGQYVYSHEGYYDETELVTIERVAPALPTKPGALIQFDPYVPLVRGSYDKKEAWSFINNSKENQGFTDEEIIKYADGHPITVLFEGI